MNPLVRKLIVACAVALLTIVVTQEEILELGIVRRLELASLDYRFRTRTTHPSISESSHVVIVEVNDESFRSLPVRWPWPRSYYAHLVRNLKAAGAKVVGIDIILNGQDAYSPTNDEALRAAIRETGIVVLAGKMDSPRDTYELLSASESFGNLFYPVDSALGLVNVRNDADGVHRRYSPFWETVHTQGDGNTDTLRIPTFSFAALNKYFALPPRSIAANHSDAFIYAGRSIPKYDASSLLINFYGPSGTFRRVKFADVLDDETVTTTEEKDSGEEINTFNDPEFGYMFDGTFKDKIVLVGSTTPEDHDLFPVSIAQGSQHGDNLMYGVEIHANVIESAVRGEFLSSQSQMSEVLLIIGFSLFSFFVSSALRGRRSKRHFVLEMFGVFFVLLQLAVIVGAAVYLFTQNSFVMAAISPMVAVVVGYVASTAYNYVTERKQRLLIKNMFSTYVNPTVVDHLIAHPENLRLGGERKELTVLFSDIEGFTTLSEGMQPETLVALLNEYFSAMTEIILKYNGTLDKYEGDAVMAFWGAPVPQEDHALRACLTALEMQEMLEKIRTRWKDEGKPLLRARIGINTGEMIVGNMGGTGKFDYTVIGDAVNLASRLEGANRVYHTKIMTGDRTYQLVKDEIVGRELDLLAVRGRSESLRAFDLLQRANESITPSMKEFLEYYAEGLRRYRLRDWVGAEETFRAARLLQPDDYPTQLHLERTVRYKQSPPGAEWNAVFELTTK